MKYVYLYLLTFIVYLGIDAVWLFVISKDFYPKEIGHLMAEDPKILPAVTFYLLFVAIALVFVVIPGYEAQSLSKILIYGALFGLITYGTYDLTNLTTLKDWPLKVTIIDMIWGMSVSTMTGLAGYYIANFLKI